jgi:hypothetical protein
LGADRVIPEFNEELHEYRVDGRRVDSVTQILKAVYPNVYGDIPAHVLHRKAQLGTAAHKVIELELQNRLDYATIHPEVRPYFESWLLWWNSLVAPEPVDIEQRFYVSPLDYTGTRDFNGLIDGNHWIIDWKCTASEVGTHRLQLAGYSWPPICNQRRGSLYLQSNGSMAKLVEYTDEQDFHDWLSTVRVFNLAKGLK